MSAAATAAGQMFVGVMDRFQVFSQWQWPTPILLEDLHYESIGLPIWDPRANPVERNHVMPIITPVYPAFNSSFSVTENTLHIIVQEFSEAERICSQIFKRTSSQGKAEEFLEGWRLLTQPFPFFETYPNFLKVWRRRQRAQARVGAPRWSALPIRDWS